MIKSFYSRHCERSEAIQGDVERGRLWIASSAAPPRNDEGYCR